MKVRATQDGHYGGYYREEGEVFEIDAKPYEVKDEAGRPVIELDDAGKPKLGPGGKPKIKMATNFSAVWMEEVPEEEDATFDYPPAGILPQYREKKVKKGKAEPSIQAQAAASVI